MDPELAASSRPRAHSDLPGAAGAPGPGLEEELSLLALASALLRARRLIAACALAGGALCAVLALARQRTYTSESSFLPQSPRTPQGLSGIAAQFGLSVPNMEGSQSPAFYGDLLRSETIVGQVVDGRYSAPKFRQGATVALADVYEIEEEVPALRRDEAIERLSDDIEAEVDGRTNVVNLQVRSPDPELSRQVNERLLALVNRFNQETRKSGAAAEREFTERRRNEVRADLRAAEDRLQSFLQRNREYRESPQLSFERERLARDINLQTQLYATISQAYEQAKIEEVRDTPVITVLEAPDLAAKADSRRLVRNVALGVILGGMLGLAVAFARFFGEQLRARNSAEYATFARLRQAAVRDLTRPMRLLGRSREEER